MYPDSRCIPPQAYRQCTRFGVTQANYLHIINCPSSTSTGGIVVKMVIGYRQPVHHAHGHETYVAARAPSLEAASEELCDPDHARLSP
nr:hypothetical protein CFP56_75194 [Quercus suber]